MLRYVAMGVLIFAALYGTKVAGDRYRGRLGSLKEYGGLVRFMQEQMSSYRASVAEIGTRWQRDHGRSKLCESGFLTLWRQRSWQEAVRGCAAVLQLRQEDVRALVRFGEELGESGLEGQLDNCERCLRYLSTAAEQAEQTLDKDLKLARTLGIGAACLVAIVLI